MKSASDLLQMILQFMAEAEDLEDGKRNALRAIERLGAGTSVGIEATSQLASGIYSPERLVQALNWFVNELRASRETTRPGLRAVPND